MISLRNTRAKRFPSKAKWLSAVAWPCWRTRRSSRSRWHFEIHAARIWKIARRFVLAHRAHAILSSQPSYLPQYAHNCHREIHQLAGEGPRNCSHLHMNLADLTTSERSLTFVRDDAIITHHLKQTCVISQ